MSNTNNTMQTQTSNVLHNAIMEAGGKDRPPMLAPGSRKPAFVCIAVDTSKETRVRRKATIGYGYSSVGRFDVFFRDQLLVFQQHQDESLYDSWTRFKDVPRCMVWLDYDEHVDSLSTMDNEVGVTSPESTTQTLPSFEEYTPPVTYLEEVEKTLGTPIKEMFDNDWGLESKEVSPLGEELSLFDRPNKVERGRIQEARRLESILQKQISQRMAPSHHDVLYVIFDEKKLGSS
ncbi:hypothetical protein Tco_0025935 [Tanacetum coccineum]